MHDARLAPIGPESDAGDPATSVAALTEFVLGRTPERWPGIRVMRSHPEREAIARWPALIHPVVHLQLGGPVRVTQRRDRQFSAYERRGDLVIFPAGVDLEVEVSGYSTGVLVGLDALTMTSKLDDDLRGDPSRIEIAGLFNGRDPHLARLMLAFLAESDRGGPGGELFAQTLAVALSAHVLRRYSSARVAPGRDGYGLDPAALRRVIAHIEDGLANRLDLAELAAVAGLSPWHFARRFRLATGTSPHRYVIHRRVERARALLRGGDQTLADIAAAVGFADQGHLGRHFSRLVGVTPAAFGRGALR